MIEYLLFGLGFYLGAAVMMLKDMIESYQSGTTVLQFVTGALAGILIWPVMVVVVAYSQYMDYKYTRVYEEENEDQTQG